MPNSPEFAPMNTMNYSKTPLALALLAATLLAGCGKDGQQTGRRRPLPIPPW